MIKKRRWHSVIASMCFICPLAWSDYSQHKLTAAFADKMVEEHNFERQYILETLRQAKKKQAILDAISRPAEKTKEWFEYRDIFVQDSRIKQGVEFWQEHSKIIDNAAKSYGVEPAIMVAIIGVETRYGRHAGSYRVLDALSTLGFDYPKRGKFFRGQLEQFFLLVREQNQDPYTLMGSYAGAMGYGQFIPSSYRSYAVDFDGDGFIDIWQNPADAIGSVANYFRAHRWKMGEPVLSRARITDDYDAEMLNKKSRPKLTLKELSAKGFSPILSEYKEETKAIPLMFKGDNGKEFWLGFDNFYAITRYNRSHLYAMAVFHLSEEILRLHGEKNTIQQAIN